MKKEKLKPLVKNTWSQEDWTSLSKIRQLQVRIAQVIYSKSWKDLFSITFWKDLNSEHYSSIEEYLFFFRYKIRWIVIVEKNGTEYCV